MKESVKKRIETIKSTENLEDLKKSLCPFFEKGGCPDCIVCKKTEADLEQCRDYYLERILIAPQDLWSDDFEKVIVLSRDPISLEEVAGIGIRCDSCYMYDKCPLYKKGYACGVKWDSNRPNTPAEFMDFLINTQYERVRRSSVFEKIDGGVPDVGLSGEIDRLHGLVAAKAEMGRERFSLSVEASGTPQSNGGGILSKIFGGGAPSLPKETCVEIPSKMISAVEEVEEIVEAEPVKIHRQSKKL